MIAKNRMWQELKRTRANIECLLNYTDTRRRWLRWYNVLIIFTSSAGALTSLFDKWFAIVATVVIAVASILKAALPNIVQTDQELSDLDRLLDFYNKYFNKLEEIWYKRFEAIIDDDEMMKLLFELKEDECDKYSLLNKGVRGITSKEQLKINAQCEKYINEVYFERE